MSRLKRTHSVVYGITLDATTVVPALCDPRCERPPAVYGHVINVPTHFNVPIRPSDERPPTMYGHFCLVPRVSVHDRYYCTEPRRQNTFRSILDTDGQKNGNYRRLKKRLPMRFDDGLCECRHYGRNREDPNHQA